MADADLKIKVTTTADTSGLDQVKGKIQDVGAAATQASQMAEALGTAIGVAFPLSAVAAATAIVGYIRNTAEESKRLTEEIDKQTQSLLKSNEQWSRLAEIARTEADLARLGQSFTSQLDQISAKISDLVKQEADISGFKRGLEALMTTPAGAFHPFSASLDKELEAERQFEQIAIRIMQHNIDAARQSEAAWQAIKLAPLTVQLSDLEQHLKELKANQDSLDTSTAIGIQMWMNYQNQITDVTGQLALLKNQMAAVQALMDKEAVTRAHAFGTEDEIAKVEWGARYNQLLQQRSKLGLDVSSATLNELIYEEQLAADQDKLRADAEKHKNAHQALVPLMREEQTILQGIRQQQELIQQSPFMGADEKSAALLKSYTAELQDLSRIMAALQAQKAGGALDPAQLEQVNQKLQQTNFEMDLLKLKAVGLQAPLRTELTNWANSFGTTATQIGKTIEQTIGASLQSVNQLLVTGKFNAQQLLQQIAMLGLQLVENLIIQHIVAMINARAAEAQAVASSKIIAAAWAAAATAVTIATEGEAAYSAPGAVAIALGAIQAELGLGTFHEGGTIKRMHSGGLAPDEVPIIAQEGEIMIRREVAQMQGMTDFLLGLNSGAFHGGGYVRRMHIGGGFSPGVSIDPHIGSPIGLGPTVTIMRDFPGFTGLDPAEYRQFEYYRNAFGPNFMYPSTPGPFTPGQPFINQFGSIYNVGSSGYPMAVQVIGPDVNLLGGSRHMGVRKTQHSGGLISRMHSGGSVGGGGFGGGIHIYAFTDLKALTRHMGSREGQKIIFDTVQGRRIDLGI